MKASESSKAGTPGVAAYPVEIYTPERKAEFVLMSAIDEDDYQAARAEVREMGLDPDRIEHLRPTRR